MPTNKISSGIRFQEPLLRKLMWVAKKNHRSLNAQIEMLAEEYVQSFENSYGEIPLFEKNTSGAE